MVFIAISKGILFDFDVGLFWNSTHYVRGRNRNHGRVTIILIKKLDWGIIFMLLQVCESKEVNLFLTLIFIDFIVKTLELTKMKGPKSHCRLKNRPDYSQNVYKIYKILSLSSDVQIQEAW